MFITSHLIYMRWQRYHVMQMHHAALAHCRSFVAFECRLLTHDGLFRVQNLLDLAHAPFTHTSTFAKGWPIPEVVRFKAEQVLLALRCYLRCSRLRTTCRCDEAEHTQP